MLKVKDKEVEQVFFPKAVDAFIPPRQRIYLKRKLPITTERAYTPIRRLYAIVGFIVIWGAILALLASFIPKTWVTNTLAEAQNTPKMSEIERVSEGEVSAYTSSVVETDSTPFITASGQVTREGIVANNCEDFGTKILINGAEYEVQDRMNKRYGCDHWDIWMPSEDMAKQWGRQDIKVVVLE